MTEIEAAPNLYRYKRTFTTSVKDRPPVDMDRDALTAYIREILGAPGSGNKASGAEGADLSKQ